MLLAAYAPAQPTYRTLFLRRDFRDFKPHRHLRVGDFPNLVALSENGEIQAGTMSESQELVLLQTFARRIRVTRQMLVNDDLGAFTDFASMIGRRVADFENATAYALVNAPTATARRWSPAPRRSLPLAAARANKATAGTRSTWAISRWAVRRSCASGRWTACPSRWARRCACWSGRTRSSRRGSSRSRCRRRRPATPTSMPASCSRWWSR